MKHAAQTGGYRRLVKRAQLDPMARQETASAPRKPLPRPGRLPAPGLSATAFSWRRSVGMMVVVAVSVIMVMALMTVGVPMRLMAVIMPAMAGRIGAAHRMK